MKNDAKHKNACHLWLLNQCEFFRGGVVFATCGIPRGKNVVKVRIFEILSKFWDKNCRSNIFLLENYVSGKTGRCSGRYLHTRILVCIYLRTDRYICA